MPELKQHGNPMRRSEGFPTTPSLPAAMREGGRARAFIDSLTLCAFLAIAGLDAFAAEAPAPGSGILDGLQFKGMTGEQGKRDHHEDTITFKDGRFRSLDCENWGFSAAPYHARKDGGVYHFRATLPSPNRGTLEWEGTIEGDKARGTFRWLHERWYWTIDRHYWFEGKRPGSQ